MNANLAAMSRRWRCRLPLTFFGLSDEYVESVYDEMFNLKYHLGVSIFESYNLPIQIRRWFLRRIQKQFEDEAKKNK